RPLVGLGAEVSGHDRQGLQGPDRFAGGPGASRVLAVRSAPGRFRRRRGPVGLRRRGRPVGLRLIRLMARPPAALRPLVGRPQKPLRVRWGVEGVVWVVHSFRYSRSRRVWDRLTGISVPLESFIRSRKFRLNQGTIFLIL